MFKNNVAEFVQIEKNHFMTSILHPYVLPLVQQLGLPTERSDIQATNIVKYEKVQKWIREAREPLSIDIVYTYNTISNRYTLLEGVISLNAILSLGQYTFMEGDELTVHESFKDVLINHNIHIHIYTTDVNEEALFKLLNG